MDNVDDIYPLLPAQEGMLFHCLKERNPGVYVSQIFAQIETELDTQAFARAWNLVLERHACLRAAFLWDGLDEPLQVIRREVTLDCRFIDVRPYTGVELAAEVERVTAVERSAIVDLAAAPLMRVVMLRLADCQWKMIWTCHHLLIDGWSGNLVLDDVVGAYRIEAGDSRPPLPDVVPFKNYLAWRQRVDISAHEQFWAPYLSGFADQNRLKPRSATDERWTASIHADETHMTDHQLPEELVRRLGELTRAEKITLSTLVHGAWALLLSSYSDQDDLVFGSTSSGRPTQLQGFDRIVGMFISTLPLRVQVDDHAVLRNCLQDLQANLFNLRDYEQTPLAKIQGWRDTDSGHSLFDTMVAFTNYPAVEADDSNFGIADLEYYSPSHYPLVLLVHAGESLSLTMVHRTQWYGAADVQQMLNKVELLLWRICEGLDVPLAELSQLTEIESEQLSTWSQGASIDLPETTLVEQIELRAASNPDQTALICGVQSLSYRQMNERANAWAERLIQRGLRPEAAAGICMGRSVNMVVAVLAVLKTGAAYVPLDPAYPLERLQNQLQQSGAHLVLVDSDSPAALNTELVHVDLLLSSEAVENNPNLHLEPDSSAYIIFTSGSSGQPKGVEVSHRNLIHSTSARTQYYPQNPSVFLLLSSLSFDSSVAGLFWTLASGGALVISEERLEQDIDKLAEVISDHGVTHTLCLPSLYSALLDYSASGALNSMKAVIVAGEAFPSGLLQKHRAILPDARLYNEYGPTEASVWATVFDTQDQPLDNPVPIGIPIPNSRVLILDHKQRVCPIGLAGEIYVGGAGVSSGYLRRNSQGNVGLSAKNENFVELNGAGISGRFYRTGDLGYFQADGNIRFVGRLDQQVKVRGHRVELGEIEQRLRQHELVDEVSVIAQGRPDIEQLLERLMVMGEEQADQLLTELGVDA